jgi:hypothetical protein
MKWLSERNLQGFILEEFGVDEYLYSFLEISCPANITAILSWYENAEAWLTFTIPVDLNNAEYEVLLLATAKAFSKSSVLLQ